MEGPQPKANRRETDPIPPSEQYSGTFPTILHCPVPCPYGTRDFVASLLELDMTWRSLSPAVLTMDFNPVSRRPHIFDTKAGAMDYLFAQARAAQKRLRAG